MGPNCQLVPPVHPLINDERKIRVKADGTPYDIEYAKPIVFGDGCWLASGVTVCGGVTIGKNCVIGAGSVVTKDIRIRGGKSLPSNSQNHRNGQRISEKRIVINNM